MPAPKTPSLTSIALALGLTLAAGACERGASSSPDDAKTDGGETKPGEQAEDGGKDYVYAEQFTLTATTKIKFELASSQGQGAAELEARSTLEAKPSGDKLELHGKVAELIGYKGSGQLDPEFIRKQAEEQGGEAMDLVAELAKSESWLVLDRKGEVDKDATKALAQNQGGENEQAMDFGLFELPNLPKVDLEVGKKVQLPTKEVERQLPFGSVPVEVDVSWTLRAVNGDIAELDVTSEGGGATEFDAGGSAGTVSVLEETIGRTVELRVVVPEVLSETAKVRALVSQLDQRVEMGERHRLGGVSMQVGAFM